MLLLNECLLLLLFRYRLSPETFGYTLERYLHITKIAYEIRRKIIPSAEENNVTAFVITTNWT